MREGDLRVEDWDVSEVDVEGKPALRLNMRVRGDRQLTVYLQREGNVLHPWDGKSRDSFADLVDAEAAIAERVLTRHGYELAPGPWE